MIMVKIFTALVVGALLTGCVTDSSQIMSDGDFGSYRGMLVSQTWRMIQAGPYAKTAPNSVQVAYSRCAADYVMTGFTPAEAARLDAYARHETALTAGEMNELTRRVKERLGGDLTYDSLDRLAAVCPSDVPAFREYFKPA
jgi:hypothetical protein